ncbi:uncharacterized protein LOC113206363 isoform X2 [Frankliniella occidentalis]|uniref:Uncharacterized protein LOC113206363 isoform X2 n=1 Tax=Frankliniella occidentalis TaxID=133901 RepID=A0A6J1SBZ4_FRAOC|nr:uncharacterized protein LOC113206363 isoform X2 [Frankliniella occidentalis]
MPPDAGPVRRSSCPRHDRVPLVAMVLQAALLVVHALLAGASASMMPNANEAILTHRKNAPVPNRHCALLEQQKNVNLEALSGYWYAVETIGHREEDRIPGEGYKEISLCPLMFLAQLDNSTDLRLLWEEPLGKIEYRFRVVDENDRGFWMSLGQQNGSLTDNEQYPYRQFAGNVQVMRAVSSDMVLTFCSPQTHHYSMIMSRNKTMSDQQLHSLNKMLADRGLLLANTRVACRGGAQASAASLGASALLGLAAVVLLLRRDRDLLT